MKLFGEYAFVVHCLMVQFQGQSIYAHRVYLFSVTKEEADASAESSSKRFSCPQMPKDSSLEGDTAASGESY